MTPRTPTRLSHGPSAFRSPRALLPAAAPRRRMAGAAVFLILLLTAAIPAAAIEVSGNVEGTWTLSQSPYVVVGHVQVLSGDSLVIEPGVQVRFTGQYRFSVRGVLIAAGTEQSPILFTRHYATENSKWGGLRIEYSTARALLRFCTLEYVDTRAQNNPYYFGALYCNSTCWVDVRSCVFRHNQARYGAGVTSYGSPITILDRCVFWDDTATADGGAYYTNNGHPVTFLNCAFYGCSAARGGALYLQNSIWTGMSNCIIWGCGASPIQVTGYEPKVRWSDVEGGYPGDDNIDADPLFVNPGAGDLRLQSGSPCRDAGDPAWFWNDPDATRNDMGAFGGPAGATGVPRPRVRFEEVGAPLMLANGGAPSWGDMNNDGWDDLAAGGHLYRNEHGTAFTDLTATAFGGTVPEGVWGDYDNDGDLDYYAAGYTNGSLWRNRGDETFEDVTLVAGVRPDTTVGGLPFCTDTASFLDYDRDGDLDLWVVGSGNWDTIVWPDFLYRNNGDGTFTDVSVESGIRDGDITMAHGRTSAPADYDLDGDTDMYIGNYWLYPNIHYRNNGNGTFTDIGAITGTRGILDWGGDIRPYFGHTISAFWSDLNLDGSDDLLVANLAHPGELWYSDVTSIYMNPAAGSCETPWAEVRAWTGIRYEETHSAVVAADFDNDADNDLYLTSVYDGRPSFFYEMTAPMQFTESAARSGTLMSNGWGASVCDWDNDGRLDMAAHSGAYGYLLMYHNATAGAGHWIKVRLRGVQSNSFGVGARITAHLDRPIVREIRTAHGVNTSTHSLSAFFGLGAAATVPLLTIRWPSGLEEGYANLPADSTYTLVEGEGEEPTGVEWDGRDGAGGGRDSGGGGSDGGVGINAGGAVWSMPCPNPAHNGIPIRFALSEPAPVRIELFDLQGRWLRTVLDGPQTSGEHEVRVAPEGLPSGVYVYRVTTPAGHYSRRCVLLK